MSTYAELAQSLMVAFAQNDIVSIQRLLHEDATYNFPGRSPFAGLHYQREAILTLSERQQQHLASYPLQQAIGETFEQDHVAGLLIEARGIVHDKKLYWNAVQIWHFQDQQADRGWLYLDDLYAFDAYWSA